MRTPAINRVARAEIWSEGRLPTTLSRPSAPVPRLDLSNKLIWTEVPRRLRLASISNNKLVSYICGQPWEENDENHYLRDGCGGRGAARSRRRSGAAAGGAADKSTRRHSRQDAVQHPLWPADLGTAGRRIDPGGDGGGGKARLAAEHRRRRFGRQSGFLPAHGRRTVGLDCRLSAQGADRGQIPAPDPGTRGGCAKVGL